ncbi:matrixin family metalloprotease [Actomonas aquatica]|uniref:Matrixin family metalloprotease n=1 Tax=Actomonas aquatica TaxID=2866162 RepID=A0ABZ1CAW4_9BACT|nr:matrixin family metalloprotease [Opitutus sp. WL0086]WRQ88520.1 matrixin family metalloprotease [Opitutus sp. WL0086]
MSILTRIPLLRPLRSLVAAALCLTALAPTARAWVFAGHSWPDGDLLFHVNMDNNDAPVISASQLLDRRTTWSAVLQDAFDVWNDELGRIQMVSTAMTETPAEDNGRNEIFFSNTVYGEAFGEGVLGITIRYGDTDNFYAIGEADVIFNNTVERWNSYRGNLRSTSRDLRRVAIHELGHAIGFSHPDEAGQDVDAIMNSIVSDVDTLASDELEGTLIFYGEALPTPAVTRAPLSQAVNVGDLVSLDFEIDGAPPGDEAGDTYGFAWYFPEYIYDNLLFTFSDPTLFIGAAQPYDAGTYTLEVGNANVLSSVETELTVNPVTVSPDTRLSNLSTRAFAGTGSQTLTVGFVVGGTGSKRVLVRAVGPTLGAAPYNVAGTHANPRLTLVRSLDGTLVASNDDWQTNSTATATEIAEVTANAGGFELPEGSKDAVLLVDLEPGVYTAQVEGDAGDEGLVIVEAYDVDAPGGSSRLTNLSTRGYVGSGSDIMIAGLVVDGPGPRTYLIRAIGDTLRDFNVAGVLDDTLLTVYRGQDVIRVKDDWDDPIAHQPLFVEAMQKVGAFPVPHDPEGINYRQESITLLTLHPGAYSLQVSGFGGLEGVALIEVYDYPED